MPRISTPSIHFLMKNRPNRRGECPILLVVRFNGRADRATGVSVKPSQWDAVRERVRASHPDAAKLNALLETYRSNLTSASATMIASGDIITPKRLVTFMTDAPKLPAAMTVGDSYATNFLRTSGNIAALASMLGRSPSTIATYIATLTKEESLLAERLKMSAD